MTHRLELVRDTPAEAVVDRSPRLGQRDTQCTSAVGWLVADRYRLVAPMTATSQKQLWKGFDELLTRTVAVHVLTPRLPRRRDVADALRLTSQLSDPRVLRVLDAGPRAGPQYAVTEWVRGRSFHSLLNRGPLPPKDAVSMVADAAAGLAMAYGAGLAHGGLTPHSLIRSDSGFVKIAGVGIDAALAGLRSDHPSVSAADTRALARLLYAGLTEHWPVDERAERRRSSATSQASRLCLPIAPFRDGFMRGPRELGANVSAEVDAIVRSGMTGRVVGDLPAIGTPAQLATALAGAAAR